MKKGILFYLSFITLFFTMAYSINAQNNTLSEEEKSEGWILLFDGESAEHWRGYNMDVLPDKGWTVKEGELIFQPPESDDWSTQSDIITKEKYKDFEFKLEWQIEKGGNSGIFYHVLEQPTQAIYWSGLEYQLLDNEYHPDAEMGISGNRKAGSLYDLLPADPQNTKPHGEWNTVRIISEGAKVEHWQNGEKIVEYERWTPEWFEMIRESKFSGHPEFGAMQEGHIGLQDHGDLVKFRNIKIRRL